MCIAILTTAHPDYPFILLNNRDEYLHRPTAPASWWPDPDAHVLGGYDLHRPAHGTWLGLTRQGRIAVLTNYRETNQALIQGARSRGMMPNAWLKSPPSSTQSPDAFAAQLIADGVQGVGGFSLCYGYVQHVIKRRPCITTTTAETTTAETTTDTTANTTAEASGLLIVSNRTPDAHGAQPILQHAGETTALSNAAYGDRSWPKVVTAEAATAAAIAASVAARETRSQLVARLLAVLDMNTMPPRREGEGWDTYLAQLRHTVFVPAIGHDLPPPPPSHDGEAVDVGATSGCYGTEKQSVILVDRQGGAFYLERTLYDGEARPIERGAGDRVFEFQIEPW